MDPAADDILELAQFLAMLITVFVMIQDMQVWTDLTKPGERQQLIKRERERRR